jgi:ATP-dependent RNA helicase DDX56/DBP9
VSRGLDFRNVSFVVNVDFPPSVESYTHRVGRTARGGAKGVALSLVESDSPQQIKMLAAIQEAQPKLAQTTTPSGAATELQTSTGQLSNNDDDGENPDMNNQYQSQPSPLEFDLSEIEGFRYRVEDVSRAVTKTAVKETRAAELRAEILNSERLQNAFFDDNKSDLQLLRHDRVATHVSKVQDHLK